MEDDARYIGTCEILKPVFRVTTRDIPEITEAVCKLSMLNTSL